MKKISITEQNKDDIYRIVKRIPFFSSVFTSSVEQFEKLLSLGEIIEVQANETVIHKGDTDLYLYFLLKGQLTVFSDENPHAQQLNSISPGEVFGLLSMLTYTPRSATIKASRDAKSILLFKLNFAYLNDDSSKSELDLNSKLHFYRMAVHNIRWTLEQNKMADPKHPLISQMLKLPIPKAAKNTVAELSELKEQSKRLSDLLLQWNEYENTDKTVIRIPGAN